jgi:hypothetical protein
VTYGIKLGNQVALKLHSSSSVPIHGISNQEGCCNDGDRLTLWGPADISAATPCARAILAKHPPLICQHRHLPLTKSTKTEPQGVDKPVPLPAPACRWCHLEHTDDHQTAIETCKGSSRGISWLGISSYKPSRVISWLGLKELRLTWPFIGKFVSDTFWWSHWFFDSTIFGKCIFWIFSKS